MPNLIAHTGKEKVKTLEPLTLKDQYFLAIEREIKRIFYDIMYRPLLEVFGMNQRQVDKQLKNSRNALLEAITAGKVWYEDGQFKGTFNARISAAIIRLGGIFNVKSKTYSLPKSKVPTEVKFAQAQANSNYEAMRAAMLSAIDNMTPATVDQISKTKEEYEKTVAHMEYDLQKTIPKTAPQTVDNPATAKSRLIVEAKLTEGQKRVIGEDWGSNLDLYIKGWTQDNILKLREQIQPHVMAGGRAEGLVKVIEDNYGVAARKAKFLARQETALLMAKFQETRYSDIGITKYRWSTAHDARVRHDHHELNGKVYRFDSPPVTNKKNGARNNPGQDFNCRCVAIPIVE